MQASHFPLPSGQTLSGDPQNSWSHPPPSGPGALGGLNLVHDGGRRGFDAWLLVREGQLFQQVHVGQGIFQGDVGGHGGSFCCPHWGGMEEKETESFRGLQTLLPSSPCPGSFQRTQGVKKHAPRPLPLATSSCGALNPCLISEDLCTVYEVLFYVYCLDWASPQPSDGRWSHIHITDGKTRLREVMLTLIQPQWPGAKDLKLCLTLEHGPKSASSFCYSRRYLSVPLLNYCITQTSMIERAKDYQLETRVWN